MRKTRILSSGMAVFVMTVAACGGSKSKSDGMPMGGGKMDMGGGDMGMMKMKMGMAAPSPDTQAVIDKIKGYASWPKFSEMPAAKFSKAHMSMYVLAFHNDVVGDAIKSGTLPLPDGAIVVKNNMMKADAPPQSLTIMSKQGGKWYYAETTPDGQVVTMDGMAQEGYDVPMCVKCHDNASGNDFLFTHTFSK